jgi:hypothetical protein
MTQFLCFQSFRAPDSISSKIPEARAAPQQQLTDSAEDPYYEGLTCLFNYDKLIIWVVLYLLDSMGRMTGGFGRRWFGVS